MQPPVTPASSAAGAPPPPPPPTTTCSTSCRFVLPPTRRHLLASSASSLLLAAAAAAAPRAASSEDDDAVTSYDPVTAAERAASASVSRRVGEAVRLLDLGRDLQARGEFPAALASFTAVATEYGDLSLSGYARVGRALVLYEEMNY
ncbi:hypothetical protein OsI_37724 [Oryza sativa Indica Group]|uniref:Uncharacterized protein n=1 Tax=Oryza sativa subsp. indica TaxID=39946 RepID=B8BNI4_ORYSI|nr:hypothetical protein OsI_37724 [Oryza sativa Indica Group]